MLAAFVILGGIVIVLLAAGLVAASKDIGRKGDAVRPETRPERGYLYFSQPWS
ncbi:hypothetical protein ACWEHA_34385 [Amycolatopsis nivea]